MQYMQTASQAGRQAETVTQNVGRSKIDGYPSLAEVGIGMEPTSYGKHRTFPWVVARWLVRLLASQPASQEAVSQSVSECWEQNCHKERIGKQAN